jgi:hypothetical protein
MNRLVKNAMKMECVGPWDSHTSDFLSNISSTLDSLERKKVQKPMKQRTTPTQIEKPKRKKKLIPFVEPPKPEDSMLTLVEESQPPSFSEESLAYPATPLKEPVSADDDNPLNINGRRIFTADSCPPTPWDLQESKNLLNIRQIELPSVTPPVTLSATTKIKQTLPVPAVPKSPVNIPDKYLSTVTVKELRNLFPPVPLIKKPNAGSHNRRMNSTFVLQSRGYILGPQMNARRKNPTEIDALL